MTEKSSPYDPFALPGGGRGSGSHNRDAADVDPVEQHLVMANPPFRNNPDLPVLVYREVVDVEHNDPANAMEQHFHRNGWGYSWRNGIFNYHHYHSTAHEVLGLAAGTATVELGGTGGPRIEMQAGDVMVVPAGVAMRNIGSSPDLIAVGAYPPEQVWDLNTGEPDESRRVERNIAKLPLPETDPVHGTNGPLISLWHETRSEK